MNAPLRMPATYDDLLAVPDHLVAELIDGELHTSPRPRLRHADALTLLTTAVVTAFGRRGSPMEPGGARRAG